VTRKTVVFVNPDGSTTTSYIALSDPVEADTDRLYEQSEQAGKDRLVYDYPVPAADR